MLTSAYISNESAICLLSEEDYLHEKEAIMVTLNEACHMMGLRKDNHCFALIYTHNI